MDSFDSLFLSGITFGDATILGADLLIPARSVFRLGVSSKEEAVRSRSGRLIFKDAQRSIRKVSEYIGDIHRPKGIKREYTEELELGTYSEGAREYGFEGFQHNPTAWVDWVVLAKGFEFIEDNEN